MARPRNSFEKQQIARERKVYRASLRDRRKSITCEVCACDFKMERLQRAHSKWCPDCRFVSLSCTECSNVFSIHRRFFNHRGALYCSKDCSIKNTAFKKTGINIEARKAYVKQHRNSNPDLYRVYTNNRRVRTVTAGQKITAQEWASLKERFNNMCLCCKRIEPDIKLSIDHIIPLARGGTNHISNIQPLCKSCNCRKHTKEIDYISAFYELKN